MHVETHYISMSVQTKFAIAFLNLQEHTPNIFAFLTPLEYKKNIYILDDFFFGNVRHNARLAIDFWICTCKKTILHVQMLGTSTGLRFNHF